MNAPINVSSKGQIVIPKDVRDRLNIRAGDQLDIVERPDGVLLRKQALKSGKSFEECMAIIRGAIKYDGPPVSIEDMNASIADMWKSGGPDFK